MTSSRKKRMSLLDNLASAGMQSAPPAPAATPSGNSAGTMMSSNRALRSARDAVDAHHVWELDPAAIDDMRPADRLTPEDVADLRDAIDTNGQTVPILVRRNPQDPDRYLLIYGRRRLEAIRLSHKVDKVRALVASMDDDAALRAQISENMARRDLSFIEKALLARALVSSGFGNQSQVAEVLTVTKSAISMAMSVVDAVGEDLIRAIGPAHGIGRPRWEALGRSIKETGASLDRLIGLAHDTRDQAAVARLTEDGGVDNDPSLLAFEAVVKAVGQAAKPEKKSNGKDPSPTRPLTVAGARGGAIKRSAKGVTLSLEGGGFADWVEREAQTLIDELHERWLQRGED
ncbi:plasmid partitioning protein RepB [Aliiroseovarius sp. KMU-50]|uniref:Plasmid partitioning protein RepB n=1 Tax=Aliiroseovarius salicola TaxID=3009082 RepID=A0ABT4W512_9RHOB|nr:plasmid partitioning protein RepB [Aliiroseovarius sp. KMU-50]MDA5095610.1 plasmid partitioning protein RepB [Aliiroseovarius sp. KMU-50]